MIIDSRPLPAPADKIVTEFAEKISRIYPDFIEGIYITGSLAMNEFIPNKSDIDFIVLCKELPGKETAGKLRFIHKAISKRWPKPDLSGSYITSESISGNEPGNIKSLNYHESRLFYGIFEMAPISLAELKTNAITIAGQKAGTLPIEIKREHINRFLCSNINSYWKTWIEKHSSWLKCKTLLLAFPRFTEWSVLGVARQLCTLQTGRIVSKREAGLYCIKQLPAKYHPIINKAIEIRKDDRSWPIVRSYGIRPSFKRLRETVSCVNYIIGEFNRTYNEKPLP